MNRDRWQDRTEHPPANLLLLHLDEELDERDSSAVRLHVDQCVQCRLACQQLSRGMSHFLTFRDSAVVPAPVPHVNTLYQKLASFNSSSEPPSFLARIRDLLRMDSSGKMALAGGFALVLLVVLGIRFLGNPEQSVYASQLLDDARNASDSLIAHSKVLDQRVRLRRGSFVMDADVHHGRPGRLEARSQNIDRKLQQELDLAHVNLNDPLNVGDFAAWRTTLPWKVDSVSENSQSVTITTHATGTEISGGTLTLSRADWRPIGRSVEVRGEAPIEISEVSYTIGDASAPSPEIAVASPSAVPEGVAAAPIPTVISALELEASELELREALHTIGADVSASPEIWRADHAVLLHLHPQVTTQSASIRDTISHIPHVKESDADSPNGSDVEVAQQSNGAVASSHPSAENPQNSQTGSEFLDSMLARSSHANADAAALDQLAKRYSVDSIKGLPPDMRVRVNRLAASLLSALQRDSADYVKLVSPTLDQMASEQHVAEPKDDGLGLPGCLSWQQNAALAAPQLRELENDVAQLVAPDQSNAAPADSRKLIAESLKAKSFLQVHLMSTCQLFSVN
jgi:hypothetical protein